MNYRHFAGETSKADRQDLIDRINNTARNEFLHPVSGVRKSLFVHRGRHAKPSRIVSPTRSIVALTLVVSSLCVTPAANADAVKSVVESKTASAYDSHSALDDSGKADVEVTTFDSDVAGRSPELGDISSESSSSLRPQSLLKVPQTEGDVSPTAVVPASGTWGTCRWDIDSDGVLTIHAGTGADSASTTGAPWYKWASDITAVRSDGTVFMPSTAVGLFYGCVNLTDISGLSKFDTSRLSNAHSMFRDCQKLTDLSPLSGWATSNLKILDWTFFGCGELTNLDALSNWDTANLQSLYRTFERCAGLTDVSGLSSWRTPNLKSMYYTFAYDQIADFTALKNWDVSKVTSMECLFESNKVISNADFTAGWDTSSLTNITQIFHLCHGMKNYKALANWKTGKITHMHGAFFQANMSNANMTYISNWDTSSLISIAQAFAGCPMTNLDALRNWNTDKLRGMGLAFWGCGSLTDTSALADWNLNSITSNDNPFTSCDKLSIVGVPTVDHNGAWLLARYTELTGTKGWTAYDWVPVNRNLTSSQVKAGYTGSNTTITDVRVWRLGVKYWGTCPWWVDAEGILHINDVPGEGTGADVRVSQADAPTPEDTAQIPWWAERRNIKGIATQSRVVMPESSTGLFMYMPNLTEVSGLSKWDASQVRDMDNMFRVDASLQDLTGIEDWNVSQVEDMNCMFWGNKALTGIDPLAQWDTTSLTNTNFMFQGTIKLRSLRPLSSWKMGGVTTMICMFEGAISLVDLDGLEDWDVSNVTDMANFVSSIAYATADNPNLNEYGPSHLVDVSSLEHWNVSNVHNFTAMFAGARITDTDALEHWDVHSGTTFKAMFTHCDKLADTSALASWKMDEDALAKSSEPMSYMFRNCSSIVRAGVPAVGKGASYVAPAYPDRNWTDETLPITPLKDSNGIYPYMTSNDEDQEFTDNGGVFIPYQPVYIVTFDDNGATKPGVLPDRQWAYVNPTGGQSGSVNLPVGYKGLRTGYHFAGWSTTPDASSGVISPDDATWRPSGGLSTGDPSKIVLYAVWEANLTSELPSTGSRGLIELVLGFFGTVGLVVVTGRTRKPRHGA